MKLLPGTITHSWLPASRDGAAGGERRGERLWRAFLRSAGAGLGWRRLRRGRKHGRTDPCPHSRVLCWRWERCGLGSTTPSQAGGAARGQCQPRSSRARGLWTFPSCPSLLNSILTQWPSSWGTEGAHRGPFIFPSKLSHWTWGLWCFGRVTHHCWSFQHIQVIEMFLDSCWLCCGMWFIGGGISSGNISK